MQSSNARRIGTRQRTLLRPWIFSFLDCVVSDPEIGPVSRFTAVRVGPVLLSWRPAWAFSWVGWHRGAHESTGQVLRETPEDAKSW